jgi:beta-glucosidase
LKELKGFTKVKLRPGETKKVTLALDRRAFSFFDVKKKDWRAELGDFAILIGSSSADIRLKGTFTLASE